MSSPTEQPSVPAVDPTAHRPDDLCEHCDGAAFAADPSSCPGYLRHRTTQVYRVEGWEGGEWTMLSSTQKRVAHAELRMQQLKARFPETPMRIVAETTSYMVVGVAPGQSPATDGERLT